MPLDEIVGAINNPKRHDVTLVSRSIRRFGMAAPPVLDERTGRLVVGHGRVEAIIRLRDSGMPAPEGVSTDEHGRWLIPVYRGWSSGSDEEAAAYLVADNKHTELGGWDDDSLASLLNDIGDSALVELTGCDLESLGRVLDPGDLTIEDDAPSGQRYGVVVECRTQVEQAEVLERLADEGYKVRIL